jgi:hypothetical protein
VPYIKKQYRELIDNGETPKNPGELNYCITKLLIGYVKDRGLCYNTINDILGALSGATHEFYRRCVGPYEDEKIKENGDL